jgi:hypothetical protein
MSPFFHFSKHVCRRVRGETPMFVFIIVEQNNNRFDESEKG